MVHLYCVARLVQVLSLSDGCFSVDWHWIGLSRKDACVQTLGRGCFGSGYAGSGSCATGDDSLNRIFGGIPGTQPRTARQNPGTSRAREDHANAACIAFLESLKRASVDK